MKLVPESLYEFSSFERGRDPKVSMNIGLTRKIREWMKELGEYAWNKYDYSIGDNMEINISGNFRFPLFWDEDIPDYIKFGTIEGNLYFEHVKNVKSLHWFPKKVEGDVNFYENGIRPSEEELRSISDIEGKVELLSPTQKARKEESKRYKERGPLGSRKSHKLSDLGADLSDHSPKFSRGYKLYYALKAIGESEPEGLRYIDIIRIFYELSYGQGSFDSTMNRGWGSAFFKPGGPLKKKDYKAPF